MSGDTEDLDANPFFRSLKRKFASYYTKAESNCYIVCVPHSRAAKALGEVTKDVIETHILQPSRLFQGQYTTLNNKGIVFGHDKKIMTGEGFAAKRTVNILFEEVFYNKQAKSFRVLCIDRPLEGGTAVVDDALLPRTIDYKESCEFLWGFPENEIVMRKIDRGLKEFTESYTIVPGYLSHVVKKVQLLYEQAATDLICANPMFRRIHNNNWKLDELHQIIECYVLGKLYPKLFAPIAQMHAAEDQWFANLCEKGYLLTHEKLGVRPDLRIPMLEGIAHLNNLSNYQTPIEKLVCIKDTLHIVTETLRRKYSLEDEQPNPIATDDLIPILAYMVIHANIESLQSNVVFMNSFMYSSIRSSEIGFNLASFQAAVTFLSSEEISTIAGVPPFKQAKLTRTPSMTSTILFADERNALPTNTSPTITTQPNQKDNVQREETKKEEASTKSIDDDIPVFWSKTKALSRDSSLPTIDASGKVIMQTPGVGSGSNYKPPPPVIALEDEDLGEFLGPLTRTSVSALSRQDLTLRINIT